MLGETIVRSTVKFNFGFYRPNQKVKTKIKRYLGRTFPKVPDFRNRTKHRVSLALIWKNQLFVITLYLQNKHYGSISYTNRKF